MSQERELILSVLDVIVNHAELARASHAHATELLGKVGIIYEGDAIAGEQSDYIEQLHYVAVVEYQYMIVTKAIALFQALEHEEP